MNISLPVLTGAIGIIASGILMLVSHIVPRWFVSEAERELDTIRFGRKAFSKKESSMIGIFIHLIFSLFFGVVFGAGMNAGVLDLNLTSIALYIVVITLVLGGILLPLEGHGLFGWKEDHWMIVDLLAMNFLWVIIFWILAGILL